MAKVKRGYYSGSKAGRVKRLSVSITMQAIAGKQGFEVCAKFGKPSASRPPTHGWSKSQDRREACAVGKNPRKALRSALSQLGAKAGMRGGAFAGLKR